MTYEAYKQKRDSLTANAEALIDGGKAAEAEGVMDEIKELDAAYDASCKAQANLKALNGEARTVNPLSLGVKEDEKVGLSGQKPEPEAKMDYKNPEYVNVWAKKMMGRGLSDEESLIFDTVNSGARGMTNAGEYTHTTGNTSIVIPETVAAGIWHEVEDLYPYYADVAKTYVNGIYTLIQGESSTDAGWYDEDTETDDGKETFAQYTLSGCELARNIRVSWKLKEMAIEDFIPYIQRRLAERMGAGLAYGATHGAGKADSGAPEPLGIVTALNTDGSQVVEYTDGAMTYADFISARALVKSGYAAGLKVYANSVTIWTVLANIVDANGRPYFMADPMTGSMRFLGLEVKEDASFDDGEVLLSNAGRGYQVNINKQIVVLQQDENTKRRTNYTGYAIVDGAPLTYKAHALLTPGAAAEATAAADEETEA